MSPDGKPIQVNPAVLQSAIAQNAAGMLGASVTLMSPEGKPIQVNTAALQSAVSQNASGPLGIKYKKS